MPTTPLRRYGWRPDPHDPRDLPYRVPRSVAEALPASVDLRSALAWPIYDQGTLGSCTAQAIAAAVRHEVASHRGVDLAPSRLFVYFGERELEDTIAEDSGAYIRDGVKVVARQGVCREESWPYDIERFTERPPEACYAEALSTRVTRYQRVSQTLDDLRGCLAHGHPVVFGFLVYESFESAEVARTGTAELPGGDEQLLGGHAVLAVGYDDQEQRFLVRNSWGDSWGQAGYFTMPYEYVTSDLSSDFWALTEVSA